MHLYFGETPYAFIVLGRHHTCPCPSRRRCGQGEPRGDVQEEAVQAREEGTEEEGEREEDH